jgi:5-methylcytosine-specific restriction endonuclease McrA
MDTKRIENLSPRRKRSKPQAIAFKATLKALGKMDCFYCGKPLIWEPGMRHDGKDNYLTVDHLMPHSHAGECGPHNFVGSCYPCNIAKGNQSSFQYLGLANLRFKFNREVRKEGINDKIPFILLLRKRGKTPLSRLRSFLVKVLDPSS